MASSYVANFALAQAKKGVLDAMQLDQNNQNKEAYVQYLYCVQLLIHSLLQDAQNLDFQLVPSTKKCIQLGQQCMERVAQLASDMPVAESLTSPSSPPYTSLPTEGQGNGSLQSAQIYNSSQCQAHSLPTQLPTQAGDPAVGPLGHQKPLPLFRPVGQSEPDAGFRRRTQGPSPMEVAQLQNQKLRAAYQNRVAQLSSRRINTASMALTLQRKLAENMAIAKARQDALDKKMQERQLRLEKEAARRFASNTGMSEDEQQRRQMYTKILEYEQDCKSLLPWRQKLRDKPDDTRLMQDLVREILKYSDHPLTEMISNQQQVIFNQLHPIVSKYISDLEKIVVPFTSSRTSTISSATSEDEVSINSMGSTLSEEKMVMGGPAFPDDSSSSASVNSTQTSLENSAEVNSASVPPIDDLAADTSQTERLNDVSEDVKNDLNKAMQANKTLVKQLTAENEQIMAGLSLANTSKSTSSLETDIETEDISSSDPQSSGEVKPDGSCSSIQNEVPTVGQDMTGSEPVETDQQRLKMKQLRSVLKTVTMEIRDGLERVQTMFIVTYEQLDSSEGREMCMSCLEEPFFKPLWPYLLALFRLVNQSKEERIAMVMTKYQNTSATELGVQEKFMPSDVAPQTHEFAYHPAVAELRRLSILVSPLSKLELIVRVCRIVCQCVEEYASAAPSIGADDLLPIVSYVIIRSEMPQLVSECLSMEEFIHESYLMGEEGYCLTSVQTALGYINQL